MSDLVETKGEDTREISRAELEARLERAERAVRRLSWVISGGIGEVESSTESHAELPAFPIEKLKDWLRGKDSWWRSQNLHNTRMGSEFETSDYWDVMRKIEALEAEVKEGK